MMVIFQELGKESFWKWVKRKIKRESNPNEYVNLSLNGKTLLIQRGVVVDVPSMFLEMAEWAKKNRPELGYDYKTV